MVTTDAPQRTDVGLRDHSLSWRRRRRISSALVALLWASGAMAPILFLTSNTPPAFATIADALTSLGIVAGLVGTDLILIMLVLAARVPVIDQAIGHDRAIAVHRSLGKPALYLLLGHGLLLVCGYALSSGVDVVSEFWQLFALPNMPLAVISMLLFVAVVVTSLVAVRRRFSYEGWHLVHLLSYVAVAFAIPHQLTVGGVFAQDTPQRVYWVSLYVLAFGAILTYRFAEPVVSTLRHRIVIERVETLAPGVVSIHLRGRHLDLLGSVGGQFFVWRFWTAGTWWHSHPVSLSSVPTSTTARITVRDLGDGSGRISALPPGTVVSLEGPYGLFTPRARTSPKLAVMAAGIGITPARALIEQSDVVPGETTVVLRASDAAGGYLWHETAELVRERGGIIYSMIGPRSPTASSWLSSDDAARGVTLRSVLPHLLDSDLYLCGPSAWLDSIEADARALGLPEHQLHTERFDW